MHLAGATQLLAAVAFFAKIVSASPIAWPDDKLEAINVLRARGASEEEIAARYPRPLIAPGLVPLTHPARYPNIQSTEAIGLMVDTGREESKNIQGKKSGLKESVGNRGQEMKRRH